MHYEGRFRSFALSSVKGIYIVTKRRRYFFQMMNISWKSILLISFFHIVLSPFILRSAFRKSKRAVHFRVLIHQKCILKCTLLISTKNKYKCKNKFTIQGVTVSLSFPDRIAQFDGTAQRLRRAKWIQLGGKSPFPYLVTRRTFG